MYFYIFVRQIGAGEERKEETAAVEDRGNDLRLGAKLAQDRRIDPASYRIEIKIKARRIGIRLFFRQPGQIDRRQKQDQTESKRRRDRPALPAHGPFILYADPAGHAQQL